MSNIDFIKKCGYNLTRVFEHLVYNLSDIYKKIIYIYLQRSSPCRVCQKCGDYRFVPCSACHGSKKSGLQPQFNDLMVSLRCMVCDESGLVHCDKCEGEPR